MTKICRLCGKEFTPKVHNQIYCKRDHFTTCRICHKKINLTGRENKLKLRMYNLKGYAYCSHKCSCKGIGLDKRLKIDANIDIQKLIYLYTKTSLSCKEISKILNIPYDYVFDRVKRLNLTRSNYLQEQCRINKNKKISNILTNKYKDPKECLNMSQKCQNTYKTKTGYNWVTNNPKCVKTIVDKKFKVFYNNLNNNTKQILFNRENFRNYLLSIPFEERNLIRLCNDLSVSKWHILKSYNKYAKDIDLNKTTTNFEIDVFKFVRNIYSGQIIQNDRIAINPLELDIYIPDKKVAIECNGIYWHSSKVIQDSKYHYNKSKLCEEKGLRLIHIFEYEWYNERQQPILKNIIKNALGINEYKLYARKLKIEIRSSASMKDFFNKNNIQGFRGR